MFLRILWNRCGRTWYVTWYVSSSWGNSTSELWDVTCHMESHLPPDTSEHIPPNPSHAGWYSIYLYPVGIES